MPVSRHPWLRRADEVGRWCENALLVILLTGLMLLASSQILLRNVFSIGVPWADGLVRMTVLWLALLGAIAASRDRKHIAINLADRYLPARFMHPINILVDVFTAAVTAVLAWYSARFVLESREFGDTLLGTWPAWAFQIILPVGFALISYRYALRAIARARDGVQ
jgi:TRAP-type C4-dicarboxylate transport system permease small subunit